MQSGKSLDNRTRQSWDTEAEFGFRSQVQSFAVCVSACSVASLCPALSDPMDANLPGSSAHGILQGKILE